MNASRRIDRHQQQSHCAMLNEQGANAFFNILTSPELLDTVERLSPAHRERLFPPTQTLSMFLTQCLSQDRSCQNVVNRCAVLGGVSRCSTNTGSYVRGRARLRATFPRELAIECARSVSDKVPEYMKPNARPLRLVDGATVAMPDTEENQERYPRPNSQESGLGFPQCRLVGLFCLASGVLLDCETGPCVGKGSDEQTGLRVQLDVLERHDILVGDAFYATYFLFAELRKRGVDAVFEQNGQRKKKTDFRCGKKLGYKDHIISLSKPKLKPEWMNQQDYDEAPDELPMRELRVSGKILTTTFLSADEMPKSAIKSLYAERWNVELDFRNLKTTLSMDMLRCKTPDMVLTEIWVYFLAYNIIRLLMSQAASLHQLLPRQISFKHTVQLWLLHWQQLIQQDADIADLFKLIVQRRVGNRPGRVEPRAMTRRPKPFPWLVEPRELARGRIRLHGHP